MKEGREGEGGRRRGGRREGGREETWENRSMRKGESGSKCSHVS